MRGRPEGGRPPEPPGPDDRAVAAPRPPDRRYLAALAVAAVAVLGVGGALRGRLQAAHTPVPAAPLSEAATALGQLSQGGQLRRMAEYLAERAAAVGGAVAYASGADAAGVRWTLDTVLTTGHGHAVLVRRPTVADSLTPAVVRAPDSSGVGWRLVVGRDADGRLLSTAGVGGGFTTVRCDGRQVAAYTLSVPLAPEFAGGGVFDLDGRALGMVLRCGDRVVGVPARELAALLAAREAPDRAAIGPFGLAVDTLDVAGRAYFGADSGWLVTAVRRGSPADRAALRPGDVLAAVPVARLSDSTGAGDTLPLAVVRHGRRPTPVRLVAGPSTAPLGLDLAPPPSGGVPIAAVSHGSVADAAGLRAGDRLLQVGPLVVSTPVAANRALAGLTTRPTFLVYERDGVVRGALVGARPTSAPSAPDTAGRS